MMEVLDNEEVLNEVNGGMRDESKGKERLGEGGAERTRRFGDSFSALFNRDFSDWPNSAPNFKSETSFSLSRKVHGVAAD
jgi:hypothetical protein